MSVVLRLAIDHRFTKAHASDYLDGGLAPAERARVERHASVCPGCRSLLTSLRRMLDTLSDPSPHPRRSVTESVLERLEREG